MARTYLFHGRHQKEFIEANLVENVWFRPAEGLPGILAAVNEDADVYSLGGFKRYCK